MIGKLAIVVLLLIGATCLSDARTPKVGDYVTIETRDSGQSQYTIGVITGIGNCLIDLNATCQIRNNAVVWDQPRDISIGSNQIVELSWMTKEEFDSYNPYDHAA